MKSLFKNIDMLQVIGFLLSITVTILLWIVTGGKEPIASITMGLVLATLTQGFDLQKRIKDAEEHLLDANALSQELYRNEWLHEQIQHIVSDYLSIKDVWFDLFKLHADDDVTECRKILHGMAEGYLVIQSGGPYSPGAYGLPKTRKLAKAVAAIDDSYWRTLEAETYVRENADAVRRGVRFIRVFTYTTATLRQMIDVLQKQQGLGVEVYIAPAENLPKELNEDCVILDDRLFFRTEQTGRLQKITIDKTEVEQAVKRFDTLLRHAKKLDDVIDSLLSVS
jgi:hypothetical protein